MDYKFPPPFFHHTHFQFRYVLYMLNNIFFLIVFGIPVVKSDCYKSPSCLAVEAYYDPESGFTNDTGWVSSSDACCQICLPGTPSTVCFNASDTACTSKTGNSDYDFILMDQIWLPQFCAALAQGHDPTLSHLSGTKCTKNISSLSVHGVWPNYFGGYPQCCTQVPWTPIDPQIVMSWSVWPDLQKFWFDPTEDNSTCSICYMLNHEWEKHGTCFSPSNAEEYFTYGLHLDSYLQSYSAEVKSFQGKTVLTEDLMALYPHRVNIVCDPMDATYPSSSASDTGVLLEVQTCWDTHDNWIDCAPTSNLKFTYPCPLYTHLRI